MVTSGMYEISAKQTRLLPILNCNAIPASRLFHNTYLCHHL
jgi:hypothetical protein